MTEPDFNPPTAAETLRFTPEHTWASPAENGIVTVGITDYAQGQLGEIVWISLPSVGQEVALGVPLAEAESEKTISDVHSPCSGEVVAVNGELERVPTLVNEDPYGSGWIARVRIAEAAELDGLLDEAGYRTTLEG